MGVSQIRIAGILEDLAQAKQLAKDDPFAFETFAVEFCYPGFIGNKVQRKDGGIDGKGKLLYPVKENGEEKDIVICQVKVGKPSLESAERFDRTIEKTPGVIAGVFITLEKDDWTPAMRKVAKDAGKFKHPHSARKFPRLQHWYFKRSDLPEIVGTDEKKVDPRQADFAYWKPTEDENGK